MRLFLLAVTPGPNVGHFGLGCFDPDISATKKKKGGVSAVTINCGFGCVHA